MSADKNNRAIRPDQTDGQIASLESTELDDVELETISGGSISAYGCGLVNEAANTAACK